MFLRGTNLNIHLFLYHNLIKPKTIRLNAIDYFIMKIPNKRELQQAASNHSSDIEFKDFMKLYKDHPKEPFLFLMNDTTLPLRFRKNLL